MMTGSNRIIPANRGNCLRDGYPEGAGDVPRVSVCLITYNHRPYVEQAIDSILMQETDFPVEILVHDDSSTDGTAEVLRGYEAKYPGLIRCVFQHENQYSKGKKALPVLAKMARGDYLALLEGDDAWADPQKLAMQVVFLDTNPACVMCYGNVSQVDATGRVLQERHIPDEKCRLLLPEELIRGSHLTPTATVMFRNLPFLKHAPTHRNKVLNGDRFLVAMLAQYGMAGFVGFTPSIYRQHANGVYSALSDSQKRAAHLRTHKGIFACISPQYRPIVAETVAQIYNAEISHLRKQKESGSALRNILGFALFAVAHRHVPAVFNDLKTCAYHLRRLTLPNCPSPA